MQKKNRTIIRNMMNTARSLVAVPVWELKVNDFLEVPNNSALHGKRFMLLKFLALYPKALDGAPVSAISWELLEVQTGNKFKGTSDLMVYKVKGSKKERLAMLSHTF